MVGLRPLNPKSYSKDEDRSRRSAEKHVQDVLFATIGTTNQAQPFDIRLGKALQFLQQTLRKLAETYTCWIPICGLANSGLPLDLGNVRFAVLNDYQFNQFQSKARNPGKTLIQNSDFWKKPCAIVKVQAKDFDAAEYLAKV